MKAVKLFMTCFVLLVFCDFVQAYSPTGTALDARILIEAVRNLQGECMENKGVYLIDGYGACRGVSFSPVLERSGLGDVLEKHTWKWLPYPGKISVEEKSVMISFVWTQEAEDFFNTTVLGIDGLRIPMGLEIDLIARDGNDVFGDVYLEDDNIPDGCNMIQDDTLFDNKPSLISRLIQYPHLLKSGEKYWVKFSVTDPGSYLVSNLVTLGLSFQVSVNVGHLESILTALVNENDPDKDESAVRMGGDHFVIRGHGHEDLPVGSGGRTSMCWVRPEDNEIGCPNDPFSDSSDSNNGDGSQGSGDNSGQGTDDPDDPTIYTQDEDSDLHIKDFHLAIYGTDHWEHRVEQQLYPGQSFQIEGEARIENDSDVDADDVDIDYRVDHGKNFDTDDTKLDEEDLLDIDPGEYVTKHMGRTTISLSQDGQSVKVQGPGRSESFDVEDGFCKIYFFVDVENDDDDDISSNSDSDEYGVVEVTVIPFTPKFTATPKVATGYETVVFTDQTEGTVHTYLWDFGDGSTSNDPNPAHYYGSYGTFPVKLTVSDYTFTASTSQTITINQPDPSITITSPTKGEKWRSDKDRRIRWTWANLPYGEPIKIEYSCTGGVSWRTIYDGYTTNDGKKTWKMDKSKTKDTSNGYIRILRRSNGQELGRSPRFKIDHAKGDPKW